MNMLHSSRLSSSALSHAEFDDESGELVVTFRNGASYAYADQTIETYEALCSAASPGAYWHANLKE
jgi:hypothetical protein